MLNFSIFKIPARHTITATLFCKNFFLLLQIDQHLLEIWCRPWINFFLLSIVDHVIFYIVIFVKIKRNKFFYKVWIPINNVYYLFLLISIVIPTQREFLREIFYNNIAIISMQHSKLYFVDTFGDFSHTVEWNSLNSAWQIFLYILA